MRVIFDTVVLVRGLLDPYGRSGILLFDRADLYEWVVSLEIVAEYLDVMQRPKLVDKFQTVSSRDRDAILTQIETATLVHRTHVPAICRDPADDKFLAAAAIGDVQFIVTEDDDLLVLESHSGAAIITVESMLRILDEASGR